MSLEQTKIPADNRTDLVMKGILQKILEGMERQVGRALPECKLTARKSRLNSVHTVK